MSKRSFGGDLDTPSSSKVARLEEEAFDLCKALGNSDYDFSPILITVMEQALQEGLVQLGERPMDRSVAPFPQVSKEWEGLFKLAVHVLYGYLDEQFAAVRVAFSTYGYPLTSIGRCRHPWWEVTDVEDFGVEIIPRGLFLRWVAHRYHGPWLVKECHPLVTMCTIVDATHHVDQLPSVRVIEGQPVDDVYALLLLFGLFTSSRQTWEYYGTLLWDINLQARRKRTIISKLNY